MRVPVALTLIVLIVTALFAGCSKSVVDEKEALRNAVRAYFEAEKSGNREAVWEMLAPSSVFKRKYSYPFYVEMVARNPLRVKSYRIEEILEVEDNPDRAKMPRVEKIGSVKVHVVLAGEDGRDSEQTTTFTFLKEAGKWYKG